MLIAPGFSRTIAGVCRWMVPSGYDVLFVRVRGATMVRILIADEQDVVRLGLRTIIEAHAEWSVVSEVSDGQRAIDACVATKPDIAILDYALSGINGLEVARQIRSLVPNVRVLIFTLEHCDTLVKELLKVGVQGYALKSDSQKDLIAAIECLMAGHSFFAKKVTESLLRVFLASVPLPEHQLTWREQNIVQLVAEGHSNKQMARVLNIGVKTVETHRAAILRKLNLASTASLVRYAIRNNIVQA
jgi:DNA-binding NarL/FixJ family response regulator